MASFSRATCPLYLFTTAEDVIPVGLSIMIQLMFWAAFDCSIFHQDFKFEEQYPEPTV